MSNESETELNKSGPVDEVEDTTDYKAKHEEAEAKLKETAGRLKRLETKLERDRINNVVEDKVEKVLEKETKGLDRLDRMFLRSEGIKTDAEVKLVEDFKAETGRSVEAIVDSKAFQAELKEVRSTEATKEATPSGTKRAGQGNARDEVQYWIGKGELPPQDQPALRMKVVAAKREQAKSTNMFSDKPVVK